MKDLSPETLLSNWEGLYEAFRKATPSSPEWYGLIDMAVGVLISERIDELKRQSGSPTFSSTQRESES